MDIMEPEAVDRIKSQYLELNCWDASAITTIESSFAEFKKYLFELKNFLPSRNSKRILISNYPKLDSLTIPYFVLIASNRIMFRCWKLFQGFLASLNQMEEENALTSFRSFLENISVLSFILINLENGANKVTIARSKNDTRPVIDIMDENLNGIGTTLLGTRIDKLLKEKETAFRSSISAKTMVEKYGAKIDQRHRNECARKYMEENKIQEIPPLPKSISEVYAMLSEFIHPNAIVTMFDNNTEGKLSASETHFMLNENHRLKMLLMCIREYPRFIYLYHSVCNGIHDDLKNLFPPACTYRFEKI